MNNEKCDGCNDSACKCSVCHAGPWEECNCGAYMNNTYLDNLVAKGSLRSYEYVDLDDEGNLGQGAYRNTQRLVLQLADGERIVVECFCSGSSENTELIINSGEES